MLLILASVCLTTIAELSRCVSRVCARAACFPRPAAASREQAPCAQPVAAGVGLSRRTSKTHGGPSAEVILRPSSRRAAPSPVSYVRCHMTKRTLSPSTCCTPRPTCRTCHATTPVTKDPPIRTTPPLSGLRDCKMLERTVWCVDLSEDDVPPGACCFKKHAHNIWSRNKVAKAMCAIRHAYAALVHRGNFTFDNMRLGGTGAWHEDPMGTLVAAMTLLKWNLNYQHLLEHNLNYETRRLCAASLFLTHKLKSEDGWVSGRGIPMATVVLMEFLSTADMFAHTWSKQKRDMVATEMQLLKETPVHSLAEENVQSTTEMELARLLERGLIDEQQADAALRRVFVYFYAASVLPDRDVFEDAMESISTGQMGQAMARTVLRGTAAHTIFDSLPFAVRSFSEELVECLRVAHSKACVDNEFLKEMYDEECKRLGFTHVTHVVQSCTDLTITHISVDI